MSRLDAIFAQAPYHPGVTERPDDCIFAPFKPLPQPPTPMALALCPAFLGGFETFERGYFWETHELWEPIWMVLPEGGDKQLVQGLIQLANAGLKRAMNREQAALRILARADAHLAKAFEGRRETRMGISKSLTDSMRLAATPH